MGKGWIDKKKATTYHLVHRSQRDPLINDENASKMVMLPVNGHNILADDVPDDVLSDIEEEAADFGIFFKKNDDYDYVQHLKPIGEDKNAVYIAANIKKDSLFGSTAEMDVGLLNQENTIGFQLDLDENIREVFEALDDEAYEEDLDDGFFEQFDSKEVDDAYLLPTINEDEELEIEPWMREFRKFKNARKNSDDEFDNEECSGISMTSSAMYRNEQLTLLDDQFEKVLEDYDDEEIGELDGEDEQVLGDIDLYDENMETSHLNSIFDEFLGTTKVIGSKMRLVTRKTEENLDSIRSILKDDAKNIIEKFGEEELVKKSNAKLYLPEPRKRNEWDVESVLSMNSNIYNRPSIIKEISKGVAKIKITKGLPKLETIQEPKAFIAPVVQSRSKDESKEEKKARKQQVKELKRERRQIKKSNTLVFKDEKSRQTRIEPNHKFQAKAISLQ